MATSEVTVKVEFSLEQMETLLKEIADLRYRVEALEKRDDERGFQMPSFMTKGALEVVPPTFTMHPLEKRKGEEEC